MRGLYLKRPRDIYPLSSFIGTCNIFAEIDLLKCLEKTFLLFSNDCAMVRWR